MVLQIFSLIPCYLTISLNNLSTNMSALMESWILKISFVFSHFSFLIVSNSLFVGLDFLGIKLHHFQTWIMCIHLLFLCLFLFFSFQVVLPAISKAMLNTVEMRSIFVFFPNLMRLMLIISLLIVMLAIDFFYFFAVLVSI